MSKEYSFPSSYCSMAGLKDPWVMCRPCKKPRKAVLFQGLRSISITVTNVVSRDSHLLDASGGPVQICSGLSKHRCMTCTHCHPKTCSLPFFCCLFPFSCALVFLVFITESTWIMIAPSDSKPLEINQFVTRKCLLGLFFGLPLEIKRGKESTHFKNQILRK